MSETITKKLFLTSLSINFFIPLLLQFIYFSFPSLQEFIRWFYFSDSYWTELETFSMSNLHWKVTLISREFFACITIPYKLFYSRVETISKELRSYTPNYHRQWTRTVITTVLKLGWHLKLLSTLKCIGFALSLWLSKYPQATLRFGEQIPNVGPADGSFLKTLKFVLKIKAINHAMTGNNVKQALSDCGNELSIWNSLF